MPVRPPSVKRRTKPADQSNVARREEGEPKNVASQAKTLIPVGIAMTIVTLV